MSLLKKRQKKWIISYAGPCSIQASNGFTEAHPRWEGNSLQSNHSDVNFMQKHPQRHTQKSCLTNTWEPHIPVKLAHQIDHHKRQVLFGLRQSSHPALPTGHGDWSKMGKYVNPGKWIARWGDVCWILQGWKLVCSSMEETYKDAFFHLDMNEKASVQESCW